jgi:hypothetical protein
MVIAEASAISVLLLRLDAITITFVLSAHRCRMGACWFRFMLGQASDARALRVTDWTVERAFCHDLQRQHARRKASPIAPYPRA